MWGPDILAAGYGRTGRWALKILPACLRTFKTGGSPWFWHTRSRTFKVRVRMNQSLGHRWFYEVRGVRREKNWGLRLQAALSREEEKILEPGGWESSEFWGGAGHQRDSWREMDLRGKLISKLESISYPGNNCYHYVCLHFPECEFFVVSLLYLISTFCI